MGKSVKPMGEKYQWVNPGKMDLSALRKILEKYQIILRIISISPE